MSEPDERRGPGTVEVCDCAGARRIRRAFRYGVAACVMFALSLWFAEGYLRFDKSETQYRMALTMQEASARPILRTVVKRDSASDPPNAKYIEALAAVEEEDVILKTYEQACKLSPRDQSLLVNYGCRLYLEGRYADARDRLHDAGLLPPPNALPRYLEAAATLAGMGPGGDISDVIALVARANSTDDPMVYPKPLWHSTLPVNGQWYAKTRRDIVNRCLAPLYRMEADITLRAQKEIEAGKPENWDAWLEAMLPVGDRLVAKAKNPPEDIGANQAIAGIKLQMDILQLRDTLSENANKPRLFEDRISLLRAAGDELAAFENSRDTRIAAHAQILARPIRLVLSTLALFLGAFFLLFLLGRVFPTAYKETKSLPSHWTGALAGSAAPALWFALLIACLALRNPGTASTALEAVAAVWWTVMGAVALYALVYPLLQMKRCCAVLLLPPLDDKGCGRFSRSLRRIGWYFGMLRGVSGAFLGGFLCVLSLWVLVFRLVSGLYPFQLPLLTTGLEKEEIDLVRQVQQMLGR